MSELKTTPVTDWHREHGGRMVEFAGYSMPVQYEGVLAEHRAVRQRCGMFDVSHMAELRVRGPGARSAVDGLVTNNVASLPPGRVLYTALCQESGTVLDDLLVYCLADDDFMIVANAANHEKVAAWLRGHLGGEATLRDETDEVALFALQGPRSRELLLAWPRMRRWRDALEQLEYYHVMPVELDGPSLLSRTGYTGEWGYELYVPAAAGRRLWEELVAAGEAVELAPIGLGARDTLRLEAGYSLYGHELDEETTPFEAGIGWVVKLKARDFIGREALARQKEQGIPRRTLGVKLEGRNIARPGAPVFAGDEAVGVVTSGSFSPTLEQGIALVRVRAEAAEAALQTEIRGRRCPLQITDIPFVPSRVRG